MALFEVTPYDRRIYEEELKDFLPQKILDVHTHVWLDKYLDHKPLAPGEVKRTVTWPSLVALDNSIEDLQETYRLMLPGKDVTALMFSNSGRSQQANDYVADASRRSGFPALYFSAPEESPEEVERQIAKKLALSGISLSDVTILRAQGGQQAAMVTKDGKPNGRFAASMVDEAGMEKLLTFARNKAAALADEIYAGEIDDSPVERETFNACQNCEYSAICVFDPLRKPRRRLTAKRLEDLT